MAQCLRPQRISELENPAHSLDQIWAVGRACPSFAPAHPGLSGRPGTRIGFRDLAPRGRTRDVSGLGEGLVGLHDFPEDPFWPGAPETNQNPRRTWNWWGSPLSGHPAGQNGAYAGPGRTLKRYELCAAAIRLGRNSFLEEAAPDPLGPWRGKHQVFSTRV